MLLLIPDNPEHEHFVTLHKLLGILDKNNFEGENQLLILDLYAHIVRFYTTQVHLYTHINILVPRWVPI